MTDNRLLHGGLLGGTALLCLLLAWQVIGKMAPVQPQKVVIAVPALTLVTNLLVAFEQGMFTQHGLDAVHQQHKLGNIALQQVLNGQADMAAVGDTPFMLAVMRGEKIAIVATIANSRRGVAIVALKNRGISTMGDLNGKKLGLPLGTSMQYFADSMLLAHHIKESGVTIVNLMPEELWPALASGRVDAVTAWQPFLAQMESSKAHHLVKFYGEDLFALRVHLVATKDYIARHPDAVRKVVSAMTDATRFTQAQPEAARRLAGKYLSLDPALQDNIIDPNDFELRLDESLLLALEDQTRWAIKSGLAQGKVPNYLEYLYLDALMAAKPKAVTVIH